MHDRCCTKQLQQFPHFDSSIFYRDDIIHFLYIHDEVLLRWRDTKYSLINYTIFHISCIHFHIERRKHFKYWSNIYFHLLAQDEINSFLASNYSITFSNKKNWMRVFYFFFSSHFISSISVDIFFFVKILFKFIDNSSQFVRINSV